MKKILVSVVLLSAMIASAGPSRGFHRPPHPPMHHYRHHHQDWKAPAIMLGSVILGNTISNMLRPPETTVIVQQPVQTVTPVIVTQEPRYIWIEGRYVTRIQPNGVAIQVWEPGHYEKVN